MAGNDSVENDIFGEEPTGAEQTRPESQGSLLARVAHLAIGTAMVATDMVDQGVATALEVNRRWQAEMAPFFENLGQETADASMTALEEVFHLD